MSEPRTILVTGATGKQGRGVIDAILALPSQTFNPFHILALVRDPSSNSAQSLTKLPNVTIIQGDLNESASVFTKYGKPIWGVYSVQINSDAELAQGLTLVNAAVGNNVRHFVYSSGDRGGPQKSDDNPTKVKNFADKFEIENHLKSACQLNSDSTTYTILRPVTFFENQTRDIHGQGFARLWNQMEDGNRKLQMISVRDIGWFAAQAFANSEQSQYRNAALSIAGDELSGKDAEKIFKEVVGKNMPMAPCIVGKGLKFFLRGTIGDMFAWFEKEGYGASVAECRAAKPDMLDYRTWLKEYSGFV